MFVLGDGGWHKCCSRRRRRVTPSRGFSRVELAARMWTPRRVGGLEAASNVLRGVGGRFSSGGRRSSCIHPGKRRAATSRSRRRLHGLTAVGFCSAKAGSSREPLGAEARTSAASPAPHGIRLWYLFFWRLLDVFTKRLHSHERRLAAIGGELKRVRAPVCRNM